MTRIRSICLGLLAFVLLITSQQMAMARGELRTVSGEVILCQGGVAVTVQVDDQGQPVGPVHFCPDCVISFFVDLPLADVSCSRGLGRAEAVILPTFTRNISAEQATPSARGPPISV